MAEKITKSDAEWRAQLSDEEYEVTRRKGLEVGVTMAADWQLGKITPDYDTETCERRIRQLAQRVVRINARPAPILRRARARWIACGRCKTASLPKARLPEHDASFRRCG